MRWCSREAYQRYSVNEQKSLGKGYLGLVVNVLLRIELLFLSLFGVLVDECLASPDLASLALFARGVIPHRATCVISMVWFAAVGAGEGVFACSEAILPVLLIDVRLLAFLARNVVFVFFVVSTAPAAADWAV